MGLLRKRASKLVKAKTATTDSNADTRPDPNPATTVLLADLALRGGGQLLRHAVERGLLGKANSPAKPRNLIKGRTMAQTLIGTAITRIATRSVPGALIVGGGMLAKMLYDRKRGKDAAPKDQKAIEDQAKRGR